ncbi:MAG: hypothetical protein KJ941_07870 [Bacteroidetes bacterium]|nr:hypothetical protein [Bacteroidota bacterium]
METKNSSLKKYLYWALFFGILIFSTWMYFRYWFVYSEGTRVGILYKFSNKGTVFKTYEGEMLLPGLSTKKGQANQLNTNNFFFSVDDEDLAKKLMDMQGMELELHYNNYNHALPWRGDAYTEGDGQFVVDRLVKIKNKSPNGYGL